MKQTGSLYLNTPISSPLSMLENKSDTPTKSRVWYQWTSFHLP